MIEALKQALDAFHQIFESTIPYREDGTCTINDKSIELSNKAIASLRQAIAELESQEAVAYLCEPDEDGLFDLPTPDKGCKDCFPVYRHPQSTWVGLTVEEIAACCRESTTTQLSFYNAIEAKLKEKNT